MENLIKLREAFIIGRTALERLENGATLRSVKTLLEYSGHSRYFIRALDKGRKEGFSQCVNLALNEIQTTLKEGGQPAPESASEAKTPIAVIGYFNPATLRNDLMRMADNFKEVMPVDYITALYKAFFEEAKTLIKREFPTVYIRLMIDSRENPAIDVQGGEPRHHERIKELISIAWECGDWHTLPNDPAVYASA